MANIRVCANNIQATLRVAVSSDLKETMLISCDKTPHNPSGLPKRGPISGPGQQAIAPKGEALEPIRFNFERRPQLGTYEMPTDVNLFTG